MSTQLSDFELQRRHALDELNKLGINPYPGELFDVNQHAAAILVEFEKNPEAPELKQVVIAGRIMSVRDMGKAAFVVLQDASGKIQLYVKRDDICPGDDKTLYDVLFKKLLDIGDIIGVTGFVFKTKMGKRLFMYRS